MTVADPPANRTVVASPVLLPLEVDGERFRGARAVTPNLEAARALRVPSRTLEKEAARVLSVRGVHMATEIEARRAVARAVRRLGAADDVDGFASAALDTLRELMRAGRGVERLRGDAEPRVRRLGEIVAEVRAVHAASDRVDRADVLWRAADAFRRHGSPRQRIAVAGYPRLPIAERDFVDAVAGAGSVVFLPVDDAPLFDENRAALEDFRARGWRIEVRNAPGAGSGAALALAWLGRAAAPETLEAVAYPDLDAEARGVLAEVKRLLRAGVPADEIAVVARHEQAYGPTLQAVAREYGVPFRVAYKVPLLETRFGAWVDAALTVLAEGFPFEATARCLADPVAGVALDRHAWPDARRTHPHGRERWRELGVVLPEPGWPETAARAEHVARLRRLFDAYGVVRNCSAWAREAHAVRVFAEGIRDPERDGDETTFGAFRAEVAELLDVLKVSDDPGSGGVQLHTPLSVFGGRFAHVLVVGAAEGHVPDPVRPDPLLDPFERARLREDLPWLEDVRAQARREEVSFWAMLQSARERLALSYPKLVGRSETLPSPYLERLGANLREAPPGPIGSWPEFRRVYLPEDAPPRRDPLLAHARHARGIERGRESAAPWDAHDGITGMPYAPPRRGVGVTRLIAMASCPFKFFLGSVLYLREPDEAPTEVDPLLRGTLYHEALHRVMLRAADGADVRATALARLDGAFADAERAVEEAFGVDLGAFPHWERDRLDHLAVLRRAIQSEDFLRDGAEVLALEADFEGAWHGIPVKGRIDRIDVRHDRVALIDYKSGKRATNPAKDATGRATLDLQLPIYRAASDALLRDLMPEGVPDAREMLYYSISGASVIRVAEPPDEEQARIAREIAQAWARGRFPVDPDSDLKACTWCAFDAVCRKGSRLERKRSDA